MVISVIDPAISYTELKKIYSDDKNMEFELYEMKNAVKYVEESLKSGLHPSMMTKEEVELMKEI